VEETAGEILPDEELSPGELPPDKMSPDRMSPDRMSPDKMSAQIADLDARIARLGAYIDARHDECAVADLCRLLDLHSMMLGRVTRMRQVQHALHGAQTRMMVFVYRVLDIIIGERKLLLEPEPHEPEQDEPGQRKPARREPGSASQPWVQGSLPCVQEG